MRIEDYALIGDLQTAALVGRDGSVDWLCLPRFDSASVFAALLGDERHGQWRLAPKGGMPARTRRYRPGTLILETDFETPDGAVRVIDFMPHRDDRAPQLIRIVEGLRGRVPMEMTLSLRPDYGAIEPWTEAAPDGIVAAAGPDAFRLSTPLPLRLEDGFVRSEFTAIEGARERFVLTWNYSFERRLRGGRRLGAGAHLRRLAGVVGSLHLRRRVPRRGPAVADHPQGDDAREDGGARGRSNHVAAGGHRGRTQLGLPVLLVARRRPRPRRAVRRRLLRGRSGLPRLSAARGDGRSVKAAGHVRDRGRAAPDRVRAGRPAWIRGLEAGTGRQRCRRPVPARRLRRARDGLAHGDRAGQKVVGWERGCRSWTTSEHLARARRGDLGGAGPGGISPTPR